MFLNIHLIRILIFCTKTKHFIYVKKIFIYFVCFVLHQKFSGKSKSSHDLIDDPRLSSVPVMETGDIEKSPGKRKNQVQNML